MTNTTDLVHRYFDLAPGADTEAYFALFDEDALVEDEGQERQGSAAIRAWRAEVPTVRYEVRDIGDENGTQVARVMISGEFPGSPVLLTFRFTFTAVGLISELRIRG